MEYKDYYAVLGIDKKASADAIKQAYRRLARKYHPDVSKEAHAEDKFKNLQEAYEVLKDPEKRKAYDQLGANWKAGQEFRPPPGGQTRYQYSGDGGEFTDSDMGGFSDFFANLFGRHGGAGHTHFDRDGGRGFQQRGSDQRAAIRISLEDAFHGTTKTIQLQMPEIDLEGNIKQAIRSLKVTIPTGASQGQQLRLSQQGGPGMGGGSAGDLYLEIDIEPHPLFSLNGKDIFLTVPVTPWEAALGADIKIPTLGGPVGMKLAPGSQSGKKLRLKGRGMPGKPHPGDQYAILKIEVPMPKTDEQRQVYQKMAEVMPFNPRKDWPV